MEPILKVCMLDFDLNVEYIYGVMIPTDGIHRQ